MPLNVPLNELQSQLRDLLISNPADALKLMLELLPDGSEKADSARTLLGEINDTNKQRLRGTLSNEELQRAYNRIRASVFDLIDSLETSDFSTQNADPKAPGAKQGEILYRIPDTMPLRQETRCVVRIAMDEESIVQDMMLDEHVTMKTLHRVSDLMQVELVDPSAEGVFSLRGINSPEQLVEDNGYTEWLFMSPPLHEGTYPLLIKVAVIELLHGQERKKEIILEEEIRILAVVPDTKAAEPAMKSAGEKFMFREGDAYRPRTAAPESTAPQFPESVVAPPAPAPATPSPAKRSSGSPWKRMAAVLVGLLLIGSTATWAIAPQEIAWVWTRYVHDSPQALESYAASYPESRHLESAVYRRAALLKTVDGYKTYREKFPEGRYTPEISRELTILESRAFEKVVENPDRNNVRQFVTDFPESSKMEAVKMIVDQADTIRPVLSPVIRQKLDARSLDLKPKPSPTDTTPLGKREIRKEELLQQQNPSRIQKYQDLKMRSDSGSFRKIKQ